MKIDQLYGDLTNKSRLIITLLTDPEITFDKLRLLTIAELGETMGHLRIDESLVIYAKDELIFGRTKEEKAFTTPSGRPYSSADIEKILQKAHERNGCPYEGRVAFSKKFRRSTIKKGESHGA